MLFIPKKSKFKKQQKGRAFNKISNNLNFNKIEGDLGLKALSFGKITSKQLKAIRQLINKIIKKSGQLQMCAFPQTPITKKPKEIRMGKGKGNVDHWVLKVKPGFILCKIRTNSLLLCSKALNLVKFRFPIKTKIVYK